jgi:hypothetical protein
MTNFLQIVWLNKQISRANPMTDAACLLAFTFGYPRERSF